MWVADENANDSKPLVHNVDQGTFVGVIRQSTSFLDNLDSKCDVYRYTDSNVASSAAGYAEEWASVPQRDFKLPNSNPKKVVLKSPYSHKRMEEALSAEPQPSWSVHSLFRVLKAVARKHDHLGLSPNHGVTCSQFVTYCFQAAALEARFGKVIPGDLLKAIKLDKPEKREFDLGKWVKEDYVGSKDTFWRAEAFQVQQRVFRSLKSDEELLKTINKYTDAAKQILPPAFRVDAKTTTVDRLLAALKHDQSNFKYMGKALKDKSGAYKAGTL